MNQTLISSLIKISYLIGLSSLPSMLLAAEDTKYNYGEALQKSIYFYDQQRAGKLPLKGNEAGNNRVEWRSDSVLNDGKDIGADLSKGFFDAGDHVKFGLPMAGTMAMLAWGGLENIEVYHQSGQLVYLLENLIWAADYFVNAHIDKEEFAIGVGDGNADHGFWGAPEIVHLDKSAGFRPTYVITAQKPGTDIAAATAAALASIHLLIEKAVLLDASKYTHYRNIAISKDYLQHAEELYAFADKYRGKYSDTFPQIAPFYNSWSGYQDELVWGAIWLFMATGNDMYLNKAEEEFTPLKEKNYIWSQNWDDNSYGSFILLAKLTDKIDYQNIAEKWLDYWVNDIAKTPNGLGWLDQWGSLRYAANTAFLAFVYGDYLNEKGNTNLADKYNEFAKLQIDYMLGDNEQARSYMVGFGINPPKRPHHRGSSGTYTNSLSGEPIDNLHILYGALVGGPSKDGNYSDDRGDYIMNEVALDYNAAFTGALASLYKTCLSNAQCRPLDNFPTKEERQRSEFGVDAKINAQGIGFIEISTNIKNLTAWPARATDELVVKYYLNLQEDIAAGLNPDDIKLRSNNFAGTIVDNKLKVHNIDKGVYYVEFTIIPSSEHGSLRPGGQSEYRREVQFRITMPNGFTTHDFSKDWSYQGIGTNTNGIGGRSIVDKFTIYEQGQQVYGINPDGNGPVEEIGRIINDSTSSIIINNPFSKQLIGISAPYYNGNDVNKVMVEILAIPNLAQLSFKNTNQIIQVGDIISATNFKNLTIKYPLSQNLENSNFIYNSFLENDLMINSEQSVLFMVENSHPIVDSTNEFVITETKQNDILPLNLTTPIDPNNDPLTIKVTSIPVGGQILLNEQPLAFGQSLEINNIQNLYIQLFTETAIGQAGIFAYQVSDNRGGMSEQRLNIILKQEETNGSCQVGFDLKNTWNDGFVLELSVKNIGSEAINNWYLEWPNISFDIVNSWNANTQINGKTLLATALAYNQVIQPAGKIVFGLQGRGKFTQPDILLLNNTLCQHNSNDTPQEDTISPDAPIIKIEQINENSINIIWDKVLDNISSSGNIQYSVILDQQVINTNYENYFNLTGLLPDTQYQVMVTSIDEAGNKTESKQVLIKTLPLDENTSKICSITLNSSTSNYWNNGATVQLNINNDGENTVNNWDLNVKLPKNIELANGWNANYKVTSEGFNASNYNWNSTILSNSSTSIGFNLNHGGTYQNMKDLLMNMIFILNNNACKLKI